LFNQINQYSFVVVSVLILVFCTLILLRIVGWKFSIPIIGILLVALIWFHMTIKTSSVLELTESSWVSINNSNEPFLLYLYSDF